MSFELTSLICIGVLVFAFLERVREQKVKRIRLRVMEEFENDRDDRMFARLSALRLKKRGF